MNRLIFAFLFVPMVIAPSARAEDAPPKPSPPFLAKLPAGVCWRMDITPSNPPPPAAAPPSGNAGPKEDSPLIAKQYVVTRSGNKRQDVTTFSDGSKAEVWIIDRIFFVKAPHAHGFASTTLIQTPYANGVPDFTDLGWVDLAHFKGLQVKNGQNCFVYYTSQRPPVYPYTDSRGAETVWVSVDTRLPVASEDEFSHAVYTFNQSVPSLIPPPECQAVLATVKAYNARIAGERMVVPP